MGNHKTKRSPHPPANILKVYVEDFTELSSWLMVKNLPANAGVPGDKGFILELGRSPGIGNGNALQYSCLENSMDRGA